LSDAITSKQKVSNLSQCVNTVITVSVPS